MNGTQESPNMDKTQEKVTFFTTNLNYTIQIIPEKKGFDGEVPFVLPAKLIRFVGGNYSTEDEETIKLIRDSKPYRRGKITEAAKGEIMAQKTVRGAITSATMREEGGTEEKSQAAIMQEKGISVCDVPGCDYVAVKDFGGSKLRMHKIGKHRLGMRPTPKKDMSLAEQKIGLKELKIEK